MKIMVAHGNELRSCTHKSTTKVPSTQTFSIYCLSKVPLHTEQRMDRKTHKKKKEAKMKIVFRRGR